MLGLIELIGVQLWSKIILVISNRTRTACSSDFEITRMISDQIALHSVQLLLFVLLREKFLQIDWVRAVVFQLNLKYVHVKITNLSRVVV